MLSVESLVNDLLANLPSFVNAAKPVDPYITSQPMLDVANIYA
jgi:hypothetical protein